MAEKATPRQREEGARLKAKRILAHLKQEDVARAIGNNYKTIGRWERGLSAVPKLERAALAKHLNFAEEEVWGVARIPHRVPRGTPPAIVEEHTGPKKRVRPRALTPADVDGVFHAVGRMAAAISDLVAEAEAARGSR